MENVSLNTPPVYKVSTYNTGRKTEDNTVDIKTLYTKEEIKNIVNLFDCLTPKVPDIFGQYRYNYDLRYNPKTDSIVLDNKNVTNHTVEIDKDGNAISIGSWHRTELEENYKPLIDDVKSRYLASAKNGNNAIESDLNALATLGKSQVN